MQLKFLQEDNFTKYISAFCVMKNLFFPFDYVTNFSRKKKIIKDSIFQFFCDIYLILQGVQSTGNQGKVREIVSSL